jgi:hypothetical protein
VGKNSEVGLAQMNKDRDLQNGIGIQMSQVQIIKVKETAEEGRNGKSKAADKKRNINNRLVGILCRDSNPMTNPPRTKLFRRKNSNIDKVEEIQFQNNRHMATSKGNWLLGSMGGMTTTTEFWFFHLGAITISSANWKEAKSEGSRVIFGGRKVKLGLRTQRRAATWYWELLEGGE